MEKKHLLDYINQSAQRSGQSRLWVLGHLGLPLSTYYRWRSRESSGDLEDQYHVPVNLDAPLASEIAAVIDYALEHPKEGYRRLCWMMVDEDIAFLSASSIYRILADRDLLCRWKKSGKSGGKYDFKPTAPHQQWHTDLMYLWVSGRWYFFIGVLDAFSRYIVHWELLETASAGAVRAVIQTALKKHPGKKPRLVTDNGVQFKGKEFRELVKEFSLKEIKIRIRHPESNGAIERFHRSLRDEGLSDKELNDKYSAEDIIAVWVDYYNHQRLHASLKYLRPVDYLTGHQDDLLAERREKLTRAAKMRRQKNRGRYQTENVKDQKAGALPPHPQDLAPSAVPA